MNRSQFSLAAGLFAITLASACSDAPVGPGDLAPTPSLAKAAADAGDDVVAGEILVGVVEGASLDEVGKAHGLTLKLNGKVKVLRGAKGNERALAAKLAKDPRVEFAEPNYLRQLHAIDPRLWAFFNPGGLSMTFTDPTDSRYGEPLPSSYASILDADEDNLEGYAAGGAPVVIGSIDTGVQMNHGEFLAGQLIAGQDWVNNDANPADDDGHGTHTTGTMVGKTVGVAGVSGAGPNVKVLVQKVCGPSGCPTSAIVNAIYAAADYPGMVAMNLSLGGRTESQAEKKAIKYAVQTKGVLVVASAGNGGNSRVACPACDPYAISVAATNWRDARSYYSQYGSGLDISAPGGEMYSNTSPEAGVYSSVIGGYDFYQGTSMAAPQVTGTAAIVASKTGLRGTNLRNRLQNTADDLGTAGYDTGFGFGRINSYRAVMGAALPAGQ